MPGPPLAVAEVRRAVRAVLAECSPGDLVLVAVSGGADSTALAAAAAFEGRRPGLRVGAVVVDHALQEGSAAAADGAARTCRRLGLDPVLVRRSTLVGEQREASAGGTEAVAREARFAILEATAAETGARLVLLGHTLDDQAEQVLLGLARGSGARSLAGMPSARPLGSGPAELRRPLLGVRRAETRAACEAEGLSWWEDPMNHDRAFARVRARRALADLEADLGPGLAEALARTADQLRVDADHLDAEADAALARLGEGARTGEGARAGTAVDVPLADLAALPTAVRRRVWRRLLLAAGAPAGQLASRHTDACDGLLTDWRGQGPIHVPGDLRVERRSDRVAVARPAPLQ